MSAPDWLTPEAGDHIGRNDVVYSLDKLRASFDVRKLSPGWLVLNPEKNGGNWLRFGVFRFARSKSDGSNTLVELVFHGEGPGGKDDSLRECRHTYWGDGGYIFYPDGRIIAKAFAELAEFYDDMATEPT